MTEDSTRLASGHDDHFVALHSGFVLGKYELQAVLGQGGFGITYKAWDSALNRAVAIKEYLPSDVAVRVDGTTVRAKSRNDQESFQWGLERFLDEARALARFEASHSIVRVYDYMQANGTAYMIMALIDGTPLQAVYRREAPLSEERLKAIVLPILDGLDDVHQAGFLHRDIKPANILIRANGQPVLIDFGAARQALGEKSRSITSVFTPGYAPFEQYTSSGKQGPWTDIYALAATLYHGISGAAPPQATDRIREDPMEPAVRIGAGRYSPQFLAAIDRGLEVFENRRPQNVAHWRDMLVGAVPLAVPMSGGTATPGYASSQSPNSQGRPSQPPTAVPTLNEQGVPSQAPVSQGAPLTQARPRGRMGLIAAVAALVLVGGGAAAFFALSPGTPQQTAANETPQQRAQRLAEEARLAAEEAKKAQEAAEAEIKRQAEQEARQKAEEERRREAERDLQRQAEQAKREAERAQRDNDADAKRRAEEEARKIAEAEAQRKAEAEKLEQERKALEAARAKAEAELAEARRQATEARQQAEALRAQAEKTRLEAEARAKAEAEAKAKAEAEAKAKAEADAKRKTEAEAKAKAEAEAKRKAEADAKAKAEAEAKRKAEAEARARADAQRAGTQPVPAAAPPPPVTSADVRNAPSTQAALAPATPAYAYSGRWVLTVDCPNVAVQPFINTSFIVTGPSFSSSFYRDGRLSGEISGSSFSGQFTFTGRMGDPFKGAMRGTARSENEFGGGAVVSGFTVGMHERQCSLALKRG